MPQWGSNHLLIASKSAKQAYTATHGHMGAYAVSLRPSEWGKPPPTTTALTRQQPGSGRGKRKDQS